MCELMGQSEESLLDNPSPSTALYQTLKRKIEDRSAVIGVCGLGYVGLPLVRTIAANGFRVLGFDIDTQKVSKLNSGESYIRHISSETIATLIAGGRLEATSDFGRIGDADVITICVPTPLTRYREPDLSYVIATTTCIAKGARPGQLIVLESGKSQLRNFDNPQGCRRSRCRSTRPRGVVLRKLRAASCAGLDARHRGSG